MLAVWLTLIQLPLAATLPEFRTNPMTPNSAIQQWAAGGCFAMLLIGLILIYTKKIFERCRANRKRNAGNCCGRRCC
ncbi:unnamed protein product [Caenorhabditis bovis]|uniref:Uncharacterized protein n=1 Tax=Caenorhabditis bovis TaxID=2654633 RepID=A0A8S1EAV1_9PELO|nr:unnamed protein product [Caenorhabditis bovis]